MHRAHPFAVAFSDICSSRYNENFDPAYDRTSWWPTGRRCNEFFDMVPAWVEPVVVGLSLAAVTCAVLAFRARRVHGRPKES